MNDNRDFTPARAIRETWRWWPAALTAGIAVIALFTVLSLLVWHIGGVFQQKTIQRNYTNTVNSQQYQVSLETQMLTHVGNITGPGGLADARRATPAASPEQQVLRAQELNELTQFCAEGINFLPQDVPAGQQLEGIYQANCLAGTVTANPPLAAPSAGS